MRMDFPYLVQSGSPNEVVLVTAEYDTGWQNSLGLCNGMQCQFHMTNTTVLSLTLTLMQCQFQMTNTTVCAVLHSA